MAKESAYNYEDYVLNIHIPKDLGDKLKEIAREEDRTMSGQVRVILSKYCEDYFNKK